MQQPLSILQQYWGYSGFRPMQGEIIDAVLAGQDTLALLPTGGGKSICFQVPGLCLGGLTLVISPLIALMKDQVERLNRLGIPATYINSSMRQEMIDAKLQGAMDGLYQFLYMSPERIHTEMFKMRLEKLPVKLLAVDEAHCISQWGYDFRPAYLEIATLRKSLPGIPVLALTASATEMVCKDIMDRLEFRKQQIFRKSFRRDNLRYLVLAEENVAERIETIVSRVQGTGIIYARTRRLTERLASWLLRKGHSAAAYHGGLKNSERSEIQQKWLDNEIRIMVATNAFGMGIDKPDVRLVIHHNLPADLESYYQEAGRGGRDGKTALAVAFKNPADIRELKRWGEDKYPEFETLQHHYQLLCQVYRIPIQGPVYESRTFFVQELAAETGISALKWYHSLKVMDREGIISFQEDPDDFAYLQVIAQPAHLHTFQEQHPRFGSLIQFMLRTLGGQVFMREIRFLPDYWAHKVDLPPLDLYEQLQRLEQHRLISYTPARENPVLTFHFPKQPLKKHQLNWEVYAFLREQQRTRLEAMMGYIEAEKGCRSSILQAYFGEQDLDPCGVCDLCSGYHKQETKDVLFEQIQQLMLARLEAGSLSYRQMINETGLGVPPQRERVLRYLLDKRLIISDSTGMLTLP